jgi:predicted TIM-barrel fold metal-dependent hydrolase
MNYEMTQQDLDELLEACKPVPMIMLQCGTPRSPKQNANDAWARLGKHMGFDPMTVRPTGQGDRFFSATPTTTEQ